MYKKYIAEGFGTFALSFIVLASLAFVGELPIGVPLIASLTLGLFVYTIGSLSGCHINPAVTLGLLSVKKISVRDALLYIASQVLGAVVALFVAKLIFAIVSPITAGTFTPTIFIAEMLGTFFFCFGIAAVVYGKAQEYVSGFVIGGSLLFGILIASLTGASGILNPAVALTLNSLSFVYILAPIVGSVLAFQVYRFMVSST